MSSLMLEHKQLFLREEQAQECRQARVHAYQVAYVKRVFESRRYFLPKTILLTIFAKAPESEKVSAIGGRERFV